MTGFLEAHTEEAVDGGDDEDVHTYWLSYKRWLWRDLLDKVMYVRLLGSPTVYKPVGDELV